MSKQQFSTVSKHVKRFSRLVTLDPGIYCAIFGSSFDMAMTMWRCQESFDSPYYEECQGHPNLVDFMEWYAKNHGEMEFSYPDDFHGFNINNIALTKTYGDRSKVKDWNRYDDLMCSIWETAKANEHGDEFFIIGVLDNDAETLEHELAHCYFGMDEDYADKQTELVRSNKKLSVKMYNTLVGMGYSGSVACDETQAYLSTGLTEKMKKFVKEKHRKPFIKVFQDRLKGTEAEKMVKSWRKGGKNED